MGTLTAQAVLDRVVVVLQDTTNVRWSSAELLNWLNDGQREIVLIKPDASVKSQATILTAGTKQALPSDGVMLLDITRNMGTNGTTPGAAIRVVSREILDAQNPTWHTDTASTTAKHFVYDPRDPKRFYIYPQSPGTNYVELVYSATPTDAATVGSTIAVDDIYMSGLIDYILYRAYSKDAEYAGNAQRAVGHYQMFSNLLGVRTAQALANNPNIAQMPFNPSVPGGAK